jgi:hypothetical protein
MLRSSPWTSLSTWRVASIADERLLVAVAVLDRAALPATPHV